MYKTFATLSRAQKKYVAILAKYRPDRDPSGEISSSFVRTLHHELLANRDHGGEKVGWPRWVFVENLVSTSVGFVPFATLEELASLDEVKEHSTKNTSEPEEDTVQLKPVRSLSQAEFDAECLEAGLEI